MQKALTRNFQIRVIHKQGLSLKTKLMAKSTSQKIKVGIFVVVGTIILIGALYSIGKRQHIFSKTTQIYAVFGNVNGLQIGNNVRYSGINVGTVSKIEMAQVGKITIQMSVEEKTRSEEHTSELQSRPQLVCRLLLEKKNMTRPTIPRP